MKTKERIKTILLVVLLLGAVLLAYLVWTGYTGADNEKMGDNSALLASAAQNQEWATPFAISCKSDAGRFGVGYSGVLVKDAYQNLSPFLSKALNKSEIKKSGEETWEKALVENGILIDYEGNVPLFAISEKFGVEMNAENVFARYMLVTEDKIYFKDTQRNLYYSMNHSAGENAMQTAMAGFTGNPCALAIELESTNVAVETVVFEDNISVASINSINVTDNFTEGQLNTLLKVFGMNYNTCGKHTEQDGSRVYVEDLSTLKIAPDGYISFESENEGEFALAIPTEGDEPTQREIIEGAGNLMSTLNSFAGGDGAIYLREFDESGAVKYGRSISGIPIDKGGIGYAGEITLKGKRVSGLCFHMRAYNATATENFALPQKLAIASIKKKSFGVLSLRYNDNVGGAIEAQWYVKK